MDDTQYWGLYVTAMPPAPPLNGTELVPVVINGIANATKTLDIANLTPNPFPNESSQISFANVGTTSSTFTTPGTAQVLVTVWINILSVTAAPTIALTVTFNDENLNAQTVTLTEVGSITSPLVATVKFITYPTITIGTDAAHDITITATVVLGAGGAISFDFGTMVAGIN